MMTATVTMATAVMMGTDRHQSRRLSLLRSGLLGAGRHPNQLGAVRLRALLRTRSLLDLALRPPRNAVVSVPPPLQMMIRMYSEILGSLDRNVDSLEIIQHIF